MRGWSLTFPLQHFAGFLVNLNTPPASEIAQDKAVAVFSDLSDRDRVWICFAIEWHDAPRELGVSLRFHCKQNQEKLVTY